MSLLIYTATHPHFERFGRRTSKHLGVDGLSHLPGRGDNSLSDTSIVITFFNGLTQQFSECGTGTLENPHHQSNTFIVILRY